MQAVSVIRGGVGARNPFLGVAAADENGRAPSAARHVGGNFAAAEMNMNGDGTGLTSQTRNANTRFSPVWVTPVANPSNRGDSAVRHDPEWSTQAFRFEQRLPGSRPSSKESLADAERRAWALVSKIDLRQYWRGWSSSISRTGSIKVV